MKTKAEIDQLEKLIGQLQGLHSEIAQLAKKSPNDGLNVFKLKLVNKVLKSGNDLLTGRYRPFDDFSQFQEEELPTNSDVTMILTQYMEQAERFRSDHMVYRDYKWKYLVNNVASDVEGKPPTMVGGNPK